jgi:hypothetical protein
VDLVTKVWIVMIFDLVHQFLSAAGEFVDPPGLVLNREGAGVVWLPPSARVEGGLVQYNAFVIKANNFCVELTDVCVFVV